MLKKIFCGIIITLFSTLCRGYYIYTPIYTPHYTTYIPIYIHTPIYTSYPYTIMQPYNASYQFINSLNSLYWLFFANNNQTPKNISKKQLLKIVATALGFAFAFVVLNISLELMIATLNN